MTKKSERLWMLAAAIWVAALGLTYWNGALIETIMDHREKTERHGKEHMFQIRNIEKLNWLRTYDQIHYLPVESSKLGLITVRNHLMALAVQYHLHQVDINIQTGKSIDDKSPITIKARGSMSNATDFLIALGDYAYLPAEKVRLTVYAEAGEAEMEARLSFQFAVQPGGRENDRPPIQAATLHASSGRAS